jgi:uncharacterized membrane protein YhaH (DUF805 family)
LAAPWFAVILAAICCAGHSSSKPTEFVAILSTIFPFFLAFIFQLWMLGRRINDANMSSKWIWRIFLISFFSYLLGLSIGKFLHIDFIKFTAPLLIFGLFALGVISFVMYFIRGTSSDNKYGSAPPKNNYVTIIFSIIVIPLSLLIAIAGTSMKTHNDNYQLQNKISKSY